MVRMSAVESRRPTAMSAGRTSTYGSVVMAASSPVATASTVVSRATDTSAVVTLGVSNSSWAAGSAIHAVRPKAAGMGPSPATMPMTRNSMGAPAP